MKIVNAIWEKVNIGLDVTEISFDNKDDLADCRDALEKTSDAEYILCNVPNTRFDINDLLAENGFAFVETKFVLENSLRFLELPQIVVKAGKNYILKEVITKEDFDSVLELIKSGVFVTDKYAVDSVVGIEKSNQRYANWLSNLVNTNKCSIYKIVDSDGLSIGFLSFYVTDKKDTLFGFLGGLYPQYRGSGLGFLISSKLSEWAISNGYKKIVTGVSSNNPDVLKIHLMCGYKISDISYVFRKAKR